MPRSLTSIAHVAGLVTAALSLAACLGATVTPRPLDPTTEPPAGSASASAAPTVSPAASPSEEPSVSPSSAPSAAPTPTTTPEPTASASPEPSSSEAPGSAEGCTGTAENQDFFEAVAQAVDWAVICAVLPDGWFLESGSYRLAGGGRVEISYRGPGGQRLELKEGVFCTEADGCVPSGSEADNAAFGPLAGQLIDLGGGDWAIVVDRSAQISWLAVGEGLDEAAIRAIGEAAIEVAG